METAAINWTTTPAEEQLICKILDRAQLLGHLAPRNRMNSEMDIKACHLNGTPLRLADLLAADEADFLHDLYGIAYHLDRTSGRLTGLFLPRFAAEVGATGEGSNHG